MAEIKRIACVSEKEGWTDEEFRRPAHESKIHGAECETGQRQISPVGYENLHLEDR